MLEEVLQQAGSFVGSGDETGDDFNDALTFYRDILGMPQQVAYATTGDDRVAILHAGVATIELATPPIHARNIDEIEDVGTDHAGRLRLALEATDTQAATDAAARSGRQVVAVPYTPSRSIIARIEGPAGWQVTLFQELATVEERCQADGFTPEPGRPSVPSGG